MKRWRMVVFLLLIGGTAQITGEGYTGKDAVVVARNYHPFSDMVETVDEINLFYKETMFVSCECRDVFYEEVSADIFIVAFRCTKVAVRDDMKRLSSPEVVVLLEDAEEQGLFDLEWEVDFNRDSVRPYNALAKDSVGLFRQMGTPFGRDYQTSVSSYDDEYR